MNLLKTILLTTVLGAVLLMQGCVNAILDPAERGSQAPIEEPADDDPSSGLPVKSRFPNLAEECIELALGSQAVDIGAALPNGFEPSGADWHPRLKKVFTVHDNGFLAMMNKNGSDVTTWPIGGDLEGVTIADPESDFVYIGREFPAAILEFDIEAGVVTRTFLLGGDDGMPENSSQGLEALTFVSIEGHPEGGEFWAGHQGDGQIYVFELPIVSSAAATTRLRTAIHHPVLSRTDLSGLDYSPEHHIVYVIYDSSNRLAIVDPGDGSVYLDRNLPQRDQEGIAVNDLCDLFIAQDTDKKFWVYQGRQGEVIISQVVARLLADRLYTVQNDDGSYDWKQIIDDPLSPELTGYQNVTGVSVWGFFNAIDLLEDQSYWDAIENAVIYFDNRIDGLLGDPHNANFKLSCPNYTVLSQYLQAHPDTILKNRVINAFNVTLNARDDDFGNDPTMRVDGMFNYMISRRSSIPGIIPWDMGLCVEAFISMSELSSDFEDDTHDSLTFVADYIENEFLPDYDIDNTLIYGDISLSMPLFVLAGRTFSSDYLGLIAGLTSRLEDLIDENGMISNGSDNGDGLEQPSAYGLMALKQIKSRYVQAVQDYLESRIDEQGRIYDPVTREETYEVEGEVLRALAMQ